MKRHILFTFIMLLILTTGAKAATTTVTFSDSCANLSLTGPDVDPGYSYYVDASGKNNRGNWYWAWFYVDTTLYNESKNLSSPSFSTKYGPFTGLHTFKLTILCGEGGMNWDSRSVELKVKKDLKKMAADICEAIKDLPDTAFKNNPSQRKNALCNKTDEVIQLIESAEANTDPTVKKQYYQEAINKLQTDIGAKMDGYSGGDPKDDWISEQYQPPIHQKVQQLVGELVNLL